MSSLPKISIVTPSFNQGHFIEETIDSVLSQQYGNLEYIIIDGGSKDQTVEIIKKYEKHLAYWVSEKDQGQSDAINKGLEKCTGVVFNWLNSDDLLEKDTLAIVGESFQDEDLDILSGREIHFSITEEVLKYGSIIYPSIEKNLMDGVIYQPSTFWRLNTLRPLLPIHAELHYLMDTDLWVRYILQNGMEKIRKIDEPLARFRLHPDSKTTMYQNRFMEERWILRVQLFQHLGLLPDSWTQIGMPLKKAHFNLPTDVHPDLDKEVYRLLYAEELAYQLYIKNDYPSLRRLIKSTLKTGVFSGKLSKYGIKMLLPNWTLNAIRN